MDAITVMVGHTPWQQQHGEALASGIRKAGGFNVIRVANGEQVRTDFVACWGWHRGAGFRKQGRQVLIMERGYLGDRFSWTSLGWNGLNGRAKFPKIDDSSRFDRLFGPLVPWHAGGAYALLIGQVPGDASLGGLDLSHWYLYTAHLAREKYGLPVRFRPHPRAVDRGIAKDVPGCATIYGSLTDALANAAVCITYNSNAGVDAVVNGCPSVVFDEGGMARPVAARTIGEIYVPDREQWAARLAWCQWSIPEIESGEAWRAVYAALHEKAAA